jgi:antitoxin (DNA-binding transcriptional repressor) of toxin-antitoxin stability system
MRTSTIGAIFRTWDEVMATKISMRQAQAELPDLIGQTVRDKEPCFIQQKGKTVAVLVGLPAWQARQRRTREEMDRNQKSRLRAYETKMKRLGPEYWPAEDQQKRLRELVEKDDSGEPLTREERGELRLLLKRHEQFMIKQAAAMQALQ